MLTEPAVPFAGYPASDMPVRLTAPFSAGLISIGRYFHAGDLALSAWALHGAAPKADSAENEIGSVLMIYQAYQAQADLGAALRPFRKFAAAALSSRFPACAMPSPLYSSSALLEALAFAGLTHTRPSFGIDSVRVGNRLVRVSEKVAQRRPFGSLLHFKKDIQADQPRVLVIAPLSGHFATLLKATVETLLPEHDVYITDWHNARDVPLRHGTFGLDDYLDYQIGFLETLGPGTHMMAVCQPCVGALAVTAIMAEDDNPAQPRSLTLMAGPIDTRINPTTVNELATTRPIEWFGANLIGIVPMRYEGAWRSVYPGFMQLSAFMSMNLERHLKSFHDYYNHLAAGDTAKAEVIRLFYEEYLAVMDMPAEFYLETVRVVFQEHLLPAGKMYWRGRRINPAAIRKTALLTVEGERDDICAVGQTLAAQDLCGSLRPYMKRHHVQTGVGHYGVFSGRRWNNEIYPIVRDVIYSSNA